MKRLRKGIWITPTPDTAGGCGELVARLADAGFDLVIPMAKLVNGSLLYHSAIGPVRDEFREFDPLAAISTEAKRRGMAVHPRVCVFPDGVQSPVMARDPSVRCLDPLGQPVPAGEADPPGVWLCPRREEVQDYELSLFLEIMTHYPIDGVHLDFIRYAGRQACFCAACRADYAKALASDIRDIAKDRENPDYAAAVAWRAEPVTRFVRRLREASRSRGMALSAAVFPAWPSPLTGVGQDWAGWCGEGLLDFVFPMTYLPLPGAMRDFALMHRAIVPPTVRLWEGIFRYAWMTPEQFAELGRGVAEGGAEGVVVFRYDFLKEEDWRAISEL